MSSSRKSFRWVMILVLVIVVLLPPVLYLLIRVAEARAWAEMRWWCNQTAAELRARPAERPILRGVAIPGNAWDEYGQGLASLPRQLDLYFADQYLLSSSDSAPGKVEELLRANASAIDALRRGASRSTVRRNDPWEHPGDSGFYRHILYASLAGCRARLLTKEGRYREAMDQLLDIAQYGEDKALNGTVTDALIGIGILTIAQNEFQRMLAAGTLSRENCIELTKALELVERGFPREAQAYAVDPMTVGFDYLQAETMQALLERMEIHDGTSPGWRYFFSDRLVLADAFRWERLWAERLSAAANATWAQARKVQDEMAEDMRLSRNPLVRRSSIIASLLQDSQPHNPFRERLAQLRLLRTAVSWSATGAVPVLDDPYGDKLHSSTTGNHFKVWSVGADGVDDGGSGEWDAKTGKDIVLRVER